MLSSTSRRRVMLWRKGVRYCCRCGGPLDGPDQASLEHIVPKSMGGRTTRSNLSLSHAECNSQAGRALWLWRRGSSALGSARDRALEAEFWYQDLSAPVTSSAMPRPEDPGFQIISAIESMETMAEGSEIRQLPFLVEQFGAGRWLKRKGQAMVRLRDGTIQRVELHWYEAHGIGRKAMKIKRRINR